MVPRVRADVSPHRLFVLQDETLALRALESQGHGDIVVQAEASEVGRQAALEVELGFTDHLEDRRNIPPSPPDVFQPPREYQQSKRTGKYQGTLGTASADAHLLSDRMEAGAVL